MSTLQPTLKSPLGASYKGRVGSEQCPALGAIWFAALASAIESPEATSSLRLGGEKAVPEDDRFLLTGLLGCDPYTARLYVAKLLALLAPSGDECSYILVSYVLLSGIISCGIGRPLSAFWSQVFSKRVSQC